jgi:hypothetical protein
MWKCRNNIRVTLICDTSVSDCVRLGSPASLSSARCMSMAGKTMGRKADRPDGLSSSVPRVCRAIRLRQCRS